MRWTHEPDRIANADRAAAENVSIQRKPVVEAAHDIPQHVRVHLVFLQVHRHLSSFRGESQFSTWLYRIATNAALMHRRTSARRPTEPLDAYLPRFDDDGRHTGTPEELCVASQADDRLDRQFLAGQARAVIAELPDLYREAFVLRDLEEMSTADVAHTLGIEPSTVRQRVHRARLMLRGYLSELLGVKP